jgi:two-component system sensor histidine kinase BarA
MPKQSDPVPHLFDSVDRSILVSDLSHELRTLLGGVIGVNELILASDLTAHQRQLSKTIDQSSKTLLTVLNDIVDLSRLEAGKIVFESAPADIQKILDEAVSGFDGLVTARRVKLKHTYSALPPIVLIDANRLRQIATYLLARLISCVEGGTIRLNASAEELSEDQCRVTIKVTGDPIGNYDHVYLTTFSEPLKPGRKHDSRWLSLYLCRHLTLLMGGECGSTINDKTCELWVSVPMKKPAFIS